MGKRPAKENEAGGAARRSWGLSNALAVGACLSARSRAGEAKALVKPTSNPLREGSCAICDEPRCHLPTWAVHCSQPPRAVAGASASACPCQRATRERVFAVAGKSNRRSFGSRAPAACTSAEMPASGYTRRMRIELHELHGRLGNAGHTGINPNPIKLIRTQGAVS